MPHHHPDQSLLLEYASGSSAEPVSLVIATHLALCPDCRAQVSELEAYGAALLETLEPSPIDDKSLEVVLDRLDDKVSLSKSPVDTEIRDIVMPEPLRGYVGQSLNIVQWRKSGKGLALANLLSDYQGYTTRLLRISAGKAMPQHTHKGCELTLVLDGSFSDETGTFQRGDFVFADSKTDHRPIAAPGGDCICLVVNEGQIRLTGSIGRWLNPFVRF